MNLLRSVSNFFCFCGVLEKTDICLAQDFCQRIRDNVEPSRGRHLIVEQIHASYEWRLLLANMLIEISGIAIISGEKDVNHSFKLIRRSDLSNYRGSEKWEIVEFPKDSNWLVYLMLALQCVVRKILCLQCSHKKLCFRSP